MKVYCTHNNRQHILFIFRSCIPDNFGVSYAQGIRAPTVKNHWSTQCCLTKLYIFKKNQRTYCNCKRQFLFEMKHIIFELCNKLFNSSHVSVLYHFCSKNAIPTRHKHIQPFPVKLHQNAK